MKFVKVDGAVICPVGGVIVVVVEEERRGCLKEMLVLPIGARGE